MIRKMFNAYATGLAIGTIAKYIILAVIDKN